MSEVEIIDRQCPWCGEEAEPGEPMSTYDEWLEAHVTECESFIAEISNIYPESNPDPWWTPEYDPDK